MSSPRADPSLPPAAMLAHEAEAVHGKTIRTDAGPKQYIELNGLESAALCLSGGGIRSASFALGVLQALATHALPKGGKPAKAATAEESLLASFHYLSTVSGGGYCGGWLSAWRCRAKDFGEVWGRLTGRPDGPDQEPHPIAWLRENSNYLTPKLGLTSADTWAALAIMLRNLVLNWLVILPVIILLILFLKLVLVLAAWLGQFPAGRWGLHAGLAALGIVSLLVALRFSTRNRPSRRTDSAGQAEFLWKHLLPAIVAALLLSLALTASANYRLYSASQWWNWIGFGAGAGLLVYLLAGLIARPKQREWKDLAFWSVTGIAYGGLMAAGARLFLPALEMPLSECGQAAALIWPFRLPIVLLLVCGVPWAIASQLVAEMLFVGLSSYQRDSDADREWFGRAAGWLLAAALAWFVVMFLVLAGSDLAREAALKLKSTILIGGGLSGLITAVLGKSHWSPARGAAKDGKGVSVNLILAIAAPLFAAALIITLSWFLDDLLFGTALSCTDFMAPQVSLSERPGLPWGVWPILGAAVLVLAVGGIASKNVNINRFSLHALYRNRLIRGFLGASNPDRQASVNPFTQFAESDNLRMHQLWPAKTGQGNAGPNVGTKDWRPFHVVNMALNIASTKRLAWQERKAEPFTVTPLHSGSSCKGFRPSESYGGPDGISLGTAVAISGAAASPNMGYHSSAPLSLLLAIFNVRLGWWLGNPGEEGEATYRDEGPATAIVPLARETFGQTTDDYGYVYLSDGGHFENLGIYEMVRRRCRVIFVSDAGADRDYAFEDLGNAVRKVALDLGVTITFRGLDKLRKRPADGSNLGPNYPPRYAVADIDYPAADGGGQKGILVYIKPSYFGIESAGVRSYAIANPDFPHQSTGNQWFSESQLESYRALGFEIADEVLRLAAGKLTTPPASLEEFFGALR